MATKYGVPDMSSRAVGKSVPPKFRISLKVAGTLYTGLVILLHDRENTFKRKGDTQKAIREAHAVIVARTCLPQAPGPRMVRRLIFTPHEGS